ncbi:MAG: STAS domain-containing protein [Firmicutes bacterium]|nr:STAS domain-containing protein [Bacillota bacterium]
MIINKTKNGDELLLALEGRLDTATAPQLGEIVSGELTGVSELIFDLEKLEYLSSAGLRVLLSAQRTMNKQGRMIVRNVNETVHDIFEITGFTEILTIQ